MSVPYEGKYAVLHHSGAEGGDHYDLLLEQQPGTGDLATWRLPLWPLPDGNTDATRLKDHRRLYLTYQGPISGDRGHVVRVAEGTARIETLTNARTWRITFQGSQANRTLTLDLLHDDQWSVRSS